jgi:hypothetical protein
MAREMLAQPESDPLDQFTYHQAREQSAKAQIMPDFFRQMADQLGAYSATRQQQAEIADAEQQRAATDTEDLYAPTESQMIRDQYGPQIADARFAAEIAAQKAVADRAKPQVYSDAPGGPMLEPGSLTDIPGIGGLLSGAKKMATDTLAPVGHAIEKGFDVVGQGVEELGADRLGTALQNIPEAAAKFKEVFGEEFEKKTGQPLNFDSGRSAILQYGLRDTAARISRTSDTVLTDYTIDPLLHATLPEFMADPIVKAVGFGAQMAPHIALSVLSGGMYDVAHAVGSVDDTAMLTKAYRDGKIDGKTFALGVGFDMLDYVPAVGGALIRNARKGFKGRTALREAMEHIDDIKRSGVSSADASRLSQSMDELDYSRQTRGVEGAPEFADVQQLEAEVAGVRAAASGKSPEEIAAMRPDAEAEAAKMGRTVEGQALPESGAQSISSTPTASPRRVYHGSGGTVRELDISPDTKLIKSDAPLTREEGHAILRSLNDAEGTQSLLGKSTALMEIFDHPENFTLDDIRDLVRGGGGKEFMDVDLPDEAFENAVKAAGYEGIDFPANQIQRAVDSQGQPYQGRNVVLYKGDRAKGAGDFSVDEGRFGTGEGSDLYGRGFYTADNPDVAAFYGKRTYGPEGSVTHILDSDPEFIRFEKEVDDAVRGMVAPVAAADDAIGQRVVARDSAVRALNEDGLDAFTQKGTSPEVQQQLREMQGRRSATVTAASVDDLQRMSKDTTQPQWTREMADAELTAREQPRQTAAAKLEQAAPEEQTTWRSMGYEHVPNDPVATAGVHSAMDSLNDVDSIPALRDWMDAHKDLVKEPVDVSATSPFRVNGKMDFEAARYELRSQVKASGKLNDFDGTERPLADAIGTRKQPDLGNCAMKSVGKAA